MSTCTNNYANNTVSAANVLFTVQSPGPGTATQFDPWVGVGRGSNLTTDELLQAGIQISNNAVPQYQVWYEVYPLHTAKYPGFPVTIHLNDQIYIEVYYVGQYAYFYVSDNTQGIAKSYPPYAFTGATGGASEFVIEKSGTYPLTHWASPPTFMMDESQADINGTWTCAGAVNHISIQMYDHAPYTAATELAYGGAWTDPPTYCDFPLYRTSNY